MAGAILEKSWAEVQSELFTPEEIAASRARIKMAITLSKARKARGLTQKKLSELAGVKQSAISRLERGDVNIRLGTLAKLSAALNMKMQVVPLE